MLRTFYLELYSKQRALEERRRVRREHLIRQALESKHKMMIGGKRTDRPGGIS